jgi:hypothetical protein
MSWPACATARRRRSTTIRPPPNWPPTGIVTNFAGPSNPDGAAWADIRYFGITYGRRHRCGDGIRRVLDVRRLHRNAGHRARRQVPGAQRHGGRSDAFLDAWATLRRGRRPPAPLGDLYAQEMIEEIVGGLDVAQRWGVADGQLALASQDDQQPGDQPDRATVHRRRRSTRRGRCADERRTGRHRVIALRPAFAAGHRRRPPFPAGVGRLDA